MSHWILFTIIAIFYNNFTIGLRVKYETCRELGSKTYTYPYNRIDYDACADPVFCSGISDDEYQTIDPNNGFIIEAGSWATKTITVQPSVYDSNTDCLYYDNSQVMKKNQFYRFSYDNADSDSCGCDTIGNTIFCYDCYIWMCSDDQSTLCTSAEGTPAPTPQPTTGALSTTNDFCDRDYSLSLTNNAQICDMMDLDSINYETSKLFGIGTEGLHSSGPRAAILWKDNELYLLVVYMEVSEKVIYTDLFDNYGKPIVSNHVIVNITGDDIHENNDLEDVEIVIKKFIELDEYEDITQFMIMYRYDYDDIVKYTLCEFDGLSINNIYEKKEFIPTIADNTDLYLYYYSSSYLFKADAFIIFGRGEYSSRAGVIVFDLNGNILNENGINFEIDYVGSDGFGSTVYGISCGFNSTHDICLLNYVEDGSSTHEYSLGSMIAVQRANENDAHVSISIVKDVFDVDYNANYKVDDAYTPVIITPGYDKFFLQIGGMDYNCCPWYMSAAVYDLNGNVIVNEFSFSEDTIYGADCYATYRSGVIVCELAAGDMYVYDVNGDALINNPGTFLNENKVNDYIMQHYSSKFAEFGEITDVSDIQIVPLTSNDFWVVFSAEIANYENDIILAMKMSVYDECCDVYVYPEESEESDGTSGSISLNEDAAFYLYIIIFVMIL